MTTSVELLQDLFYRCKFQELLSRLDATGTLDAERSLIKANALFELHRVDDARQVLEGVSRGERPSDTVFDEGYSYALARHLYLNAQPEEAREIFEEIRAKTTSERHRFKALLGIANTYFSAQQYSKIPPLITELCAFEPLERDDERISLMIFLGNYYFASGSSNELAKQYFKKALSSAARNTWTYFIVRCLYYIAMVCEKDGQTSELMWTLELLQSFVDESEQLFFAHMVNSTFKNHFSINTPMEFDASNRRILIKDKWVAFHDRPLLFQFLQLLHATGAFVEKESIARDLWPAEEYKSRVHDPRIFDIAKRARQVIEAYENQPVVLLSGRMGYKLASM